MHLAHPVKIADQTPEGMFAAKYAWLLRWALHFSHNDRAAAEDLVQETFVRMLLSWDKLHTLHDLEPLLYSYLRYAHLTERRKGRSYAFQSLSTVDSDTLAISLRTSTSFDQIEVQNELRSILTFLLWRCVSAKFASVFLLRFFHGFYPEEIASICLVTRHSVDLSLRHARAELKTYLLEPHHVHVPGRKRMPDYQHPNVAIPVHEFVHELQRDIFSSPHEACPAPEDLERHYRSVTLRSLDCNLIAHIVTCESCLDKVTALSGAPPPSARSMEDSLGSASRKESKKANSPEKAIVARTITEGKRRMREIFEHHPSGLAIALNGEVFAVRDVSSPRAVLKIETHSIEKLYIVEVFSEQGLLMLALPLLDSPPLDSPQLRQTIALSAGRALTLFVDFTCDGVSIEAIYEDPYFSSDALAEEATHITEFERPRVASYQGSVQHGAIAEIPPQAKPRLWWRRLMDGIRAWILRARPLAFITAGTLAAFVLLVWMQTNRMRDRVRFDHSLESSVIAENNVPTMPGGGAVHQRVQIRAMGKSIQHDIYRDAKGHRNAKKRAMDGDEQLLNTKLAQAGLDWSNPLSAASFKRWHDHLIRPSDEVKTSGNSLLVFTSTVPNGLVRSESLTVRSSDFHTVARTVMLEDHESIEVAELSYEIVPWDAVSNDWLEPQTGATSPNASRRHVEKSLSIPSRLSESQIDIAALGALLAIQELHADTERLQMTRSANGVEVNGVVESESRKQQIVARLRTISHVIPGIFTYQELDAKPGTPSSTEVVKAVSVISGDSQLDRYCRAARIAHDECERLSYRFLNSSTTLVRDSNRLSELQQQYPSGRPLTSRAQFLLAGLVAGHVDHLNAALWDQEKTLEALSLESGPAEPAKGGNSTTLISAAAQNLALTRELVYASDEHSRTVTVIVREIAISLRETRAAISRIPTSSADNTATSSGTPTPHRD
jgi:RNA polymerase sigma factor (sigma-70 family)